MVWQRMTTAGKKSWEAAGRRLAAPSMISFLLCSSSARGPLTFLSAFVRRLVWSYIVLALTFRAVSGHGKDILGGDSESLTSSGRRAMRGDFFRP